MTEDGKPLEALLEDAARARRLAIVLDGDPAALELERHAEEVASPRSADQFCRGLMNCVTSAGPRSRPHQHVSANSRRLHFLRHTAIVMNMLKAA
jgi:hypothetical protein